jgi:hypothetical protein
MQPINRMAELQMASYLGMALSAFPDTSHRRLAKPEKPKKRRDKAIRDKAKMVKQSRKRGRK